MEVRELAYIISMFLFALQFLFSALVSKVSKPLRKTNKIIKDEFKIYLAELEKKYDITSPSLLRIRILSIFSVVKNEEEKEKIREHLKTIVNKNNGKPKKLFLLNLSTVFFSLVCLYILLLFVHSEPLTYLSYIVNILVILIWISRKRWIFSILFGVFGFLTYPFVPAHIMLWVGLNLIFGFVILFLKKEE